MLVIYNTFFRGLVVVMLEKWSLSSLNCIVMGPNLLHGNLVKNAHSLC